MKEVLRKSSSSQAANRGRPKIQDDASRRRSIIEHACKAFVELGFASTSTAEVARRARVSKRTIYELFSDKKELFAAVLAEHRNLLLDLPRPEQEQCSLDETLFRIFRLDITPEERLEREAILRLMSRESILFPELSDYLYETRAVRSRELLMAWLEAVADRQNLPLHDVEIVAGLLMDVVFAALVPRRRLTESEYTETIIIHIKRRLQIVLLGLGWLNDATNIP